MQLQLETWRYFLWYKRNNILIIAYRRKNSLRKILSIHMLTYPNLSPPFSCRRKKILTKLLETLSPRCWLFVFSGQLDPELETTELKV